MNPQKIGMRAIVLAAACCLAGCPAGNDPVYIRMSNTSQVDFDSIEVRFPGQTELYGALRSGEFSEYREVSAAYSYAYAEVYSGERRFVLQPIDYLGAEFLPPGRYTYHLSVDILDEPMVEMNLDGHMGVHTERDPDDDGSVRR